MALDTNVYQALEDVVGTENISRDPAILESYSQVWGTEGLIGLTHLPRPGAVVLPASTEEVQAIVRVCNKYKVKFKALSTGWVDVMTPGPDGVQVDLRRMNRILEINEKNMYAVVEPYVISAQLKAELVKRGLNCNVTGAGPNTTALAITKMWGMSETSESTTTDGRNVLAIEWVMPDGEILRTGSLGAGDGWFCGEGPGPSLRGIARGNQGANGGMGIFTKAACRVYHWPWPGVPEIEGISPHYKFKAPEHFKLHCATFPSWEKAHDAVHRIGESQITMAQSKKPPWEVASNIGTSNKEALDLRSKIDQSLKKRILWVFIIIADSKREFDYKEKVLQKILSEYDGEPFTLLEEEVDTASLGWRLSHASGINRELFRLTGEFSGVSGGTDALLPQIEHMEHDIKMIKQLTGEGAIIGRVGEDWEFGFSHEGGRFYHLENVFPVKSTQEAREAVRRLSEISFATALDKHYPLPIVGLGNEFVNFVGPHCSNYHLWVRKIKQAFDPNGVSEGSGYVTAEG
jgi:glycolate oxidase